MPRVIHFLIPADNPQRANEFYSQVFSWQVNKWDGGQDYWLIQTGPDGQPGINGGMMQRMAPGNCVNTIEVPSIDEYTAKVEQHGGKVVMPKMEVPQVGYLAYCQDTEGNTFGIMQLHENAQWV